MSMKPDIKVFSGRDRVSFFAETKLGRHWILTNRTDSMDNGRLFTTAKENLEDLIDAMKRDDLEVDVK